MVACCILCTVLMLLFSRKEQLTVFLNVNLKQITWPTKKTEPKSWLTRRTCWYWVTMSWKIGKKTYHQSCTNLSVAQFNSISRKTNKLNVCWYFDIFNTQHFRQKWPSTPTDVHTETLVHFKWDLAFTNIILWNGLVRKKQ